MENGRTHTAKRCSQKVRGSWTQRWYRLLDIGHNVGVLLMVWVNVVCTTDLMLILMYGILMNVCCCFNNSILNLSKWFLQWTTLCTEVDGDDDGNGKKGLLLLHLFITLTRSFGYKDELLLFSYFMEVRFFLSQPNGRSSIHCWNVHICKRRN